MSDIGVAGVFLAVALTVPSPVEKPPIWIQYGHGADGHQSYTIDQDIRQNRQELVAGERVTHARLRLTFAHPQPVKGKKKLGAYYIDMVSAYCSQDKIQIDRAQEFSADGELLAEASFLPAEKNPHIYGLFVTDYLDQECNDGANTKPVMRA